MENFYPNYYDILGRLPKDASVEAIKKAYRALAKVYHEDLNPHNTYSAKVTMQELNEAYAILSNPTKRKEYDKKLHDDDERRKKDAEQERLRKEAEKKAAETKKNPNKQTAPPNFKSPSNDASAGIGIALIAILALALIFSAGSSKGK